MRLIVLLSLLIAGLYSCNNELTTIGQDLINNTNRIEKTETSLTRTGTIKIDSFITSSGLYGNAVTEMYMGRYSDNFSGTTVAYPCFQVVPQYQPSIDKRFYLDSVTFHFAFSGKLWGDTLNLTPQTYELWQLSELPTIPDDGGYFYNVDSIQWNGQLLSTLSFLPRRSNIKNAYFKLANSPYMLDLFERMKYEDDIFKPSSTNTVSFFSFLQYFKGLTIRTSGNNHSLLGIQASADSLYMRFHYHDAETPLYFDLRLLTQRTEYQYNAIYTTPADNFKALTNQKKEVMFSEHEIALVQGLSGYMTKIVLPQPEALQPYRTVIKAEIEIKPRVWATTPVAMPSKIYVYKTNSLNEIQNPIYNTSDNPVVGNYVMDPQNSDNDRYIFNITDYYQSLSIAPPIQGLETQLLLTIPDLTSSYNRMIIRETPVLRVYYAVYNN